MPAELLDGLAIARAIRDEVAQRRRRVQRARGVMPGLTVVLVGEDPASAVYVRNKETRVRGSRHALGHDPHAARPPTQAELLAVVDRLNADPAIHGILVQMPLPKQMRRGRGHPAHRSGEGRRRLSSDQRRASC